MPTLADAEAFLGVNGLGGFRTITCEPLRSFLGCVFDVNYSTEQRTVFMSQPDYVTTILERVGMTDCNAAPTPACPGHVYTKADGPTTDEDLAELAAQGQTKSLYHTLTASTNFLAGTSRPDLVYAQGKNSKYCANPGAAHWRALKRKLRFIKGTSVVGPSAFVYT